LIYVYALVEDPPAPAIGLRGIGGHPVRTVSAGGVAAVYSGHGPAGADAANLWAHQEVVSALLGERGVVPARFGTTVADLDELTALLAAEGRRYVPVLQRLRDRVELALRAGYPPAAGAAAPAAGVAAAPGPAGLSPGRVYLRSRRLPPPPAGIDQLHARLASRSHASTWAPTGGGMGASYLVGRREVDWYRCEVEDARRRDPRLRATLTGPWPPYSFAEPVAHG
jgi:hypothetical protein